MIKHKCATVQCLSILSG